MPDTQKLTSENTFVDVILPLTLSKVYTYRVPLDLISEMKIGQRVVVQFGKRKLYTALVYNCHNQAPTEYQAKYIHALIDQDAVVLPAQLQFWDWLANYYMCSKGEVMKAALPAGLKLQSDTRIKIHPDFAAISKLEFSAIAKGLTDNEYLIIEALQLQEVLTIENLEQITGLKSVAALLKRMIDRQLIVVYEEIQQKSKPRSFVHYSLHPIFEKEEELKQLMDKLAAKSNRQLSVLLAYLQLSRQLKNASLPHEWVSRRQILETVADGQPALVALVKKQVFISQEMKLDGMLVNQNLELIQAKELNNPQTQAYLSIKTHFETFHTALLHGVTGSGKTEVYIQLIKDAISNGKQVLYLLPEIALTTQIIVRLRAVFGEQLGIYHSRFNENERAETWNNLLGIVPNKSQYNIIVGARSAVFLPFQRLGLIIVDEEHDASFKQYDPSPRYNARDSAIYLAQLHQAKVVLGSATPSVESYYNATNGKFGYVHLATRFGGVEMPQIEIVDLKEAQKKKLVKSHFSVRLLDEIKFALDKKEQVILFQNRRGFAPVVECDACAWTPKCKNCDVSLTLHKSNGQLRCHYCGFTENTPSSCRACGHSYLRSKGFGTEKIEAEIQEIFPSAKVVRMDLDTTKGKFAHQKIITDIESAGVDILVGTQMVTKGLDFDKVSLVGVLNADRMLNFPDFRAFERSFQLMEQVAGRAGRKKTTGKVIVQTYSPSHRVIQQVLNHDFSGMIADQLLERRNFLYPPFCRLIAITLRHSDESTVYSAAQFFGRELKLHFGHLVIGPEAPLIGRIRQEYQQALLLKISPDLSLLKIKAQLLQARNQFLLHPDYKYVKVIFDVDPQ